MNRLVELAELLQCAVVDTELAPEHAVAPSAEQAAARGVAPPTLGLMNALGLATSRDQLHRGSDSAPAARPSISAPAISTSSRNYQDFQRFADVDLAIAADAEATMPALIEQVKRLITPATKAKIRGARQEIRRRPSRRRAASPDRRDLWLGCEPDHDRTPLDGGVGADQERARLVPGLADIDVQLLAAASVDDGQEPPFPGRWWRHGHRLLRVGLGGAALANRKRGRLTVAIQPDGDLHDHRRVVDRGAPQDPGALGGAQQSRLPSGGHVC